MTDNQKVEASRQARLAAALRENLKRRKAQGRGRVANDTSMPPEPATTSVTAKPEG